LTGERVAVVTLGCGRNEADSDHVAGALEAEGFRVVDDPGQADCVLVNTCTFIEPARLDSIETILDACEPGGRGRPPRVLVIGCMAERYGAELAGALPEVAGVLSFADYPRLPSIVRRVLDGSGPAAQAPVMPAGARALPLAPVVSGRPGAAGVPSRPPTASFPVRTSPRGPWAYLKIAGGCDRKCTFCTIPSYRGRFASRPVQEIAAEAGWLAGQGVRELVCVSENTTSYGKDMPEGRSAQVALIRALEGIERLARVRFMYLQPAELGPELLDAIAASPIVASYYDLSLQHASGSVLSRMARSGDAQAFLDLVEGIRSRDPGAVFRSSFIVGFPGERDADVAELEAFLEAARLDWAGFFAFSPEDGTAAADMDGQVHPDEAARRRERLVGVQEAVADDRALSFVGRRLDVLVEEVSGGVAIGRSYRESPETDGEVRLPAAGLEVGDLLEVLVEAACGVDLDARPAAAGSGR
jgi:ribosomal protein S12 methylthiotransferase RimO